MKKEERLKQLDKDIEDYREKIKDLQFELISMGEKSMINDKIYEVYNEIIALDINLQWLKQDDEFWYRLDDAMFEFIQKIQKEGYKIVGFRYIPEGRDFGVLVSKKESDFWGGDKH